MVAVTFFRRHWLLALSIALFASCLLFETAYYAAFPIDRSIGNGWAALVIGWLGILEGIPAWLANPLLIAAWIAYGRGKHQLSLLLSMAAAALMLSFSLVTEMEVGTSGSGPVPLIFLLARQKKLAQRFAILIRHEGQGSIEFPVDRLQLEVEQDPWKRGPES